MLRHRQATSFSLRYDPEAVLWLGFTSKDSAVKAKYELFLKTWPEARQRIPYAQMQEMRITPELATYKDILHQVFLQLIDGGLNTPEEIKAFLEPHSPPAPPPQVTIKRTRAKRNVEKIKEKAFDEDDEAEDGAEEEDLDDIGGGDEEEIDLGLPMIKGDALDEDLGDEEEAESDEADAGDDEDEEPVRKGRGKQAPAPKPDKAAHKVEEAKGKSGSQKAAVAAKPVEAKTAAAANHAHAAKGKPEPPKPEKAKTAAPPAAAKKPVPIPAKPCSEAGTCCQTRGKDPGKSSRQGGPGKGACQAGTQSSSSKEGRSGREGKAPCSGQAGKSCCEEACAQDGQEALIH